MHLLLAAADTDYTALGVIGGLTVLLFVIAMVVVMMIPYFRIVQKAGFNGWLCLLMLVPLVNVVMLWMFAFTTWPVEQEAQRAAAPPIITPTV